MPIASKRQQQLYTELRETLIRASSRDLRIWGRRSAARLPAIGARRVRTLGTLAGAASRLAGAQRQRPLAASRHALFIDHLATRSADAIDHSIGIYNGAARMFDEVRQSLLEQPGRMVPALFAVALGAHDKTGDGRPPVLDDVAPNSGPFARSIVSDTVVETAILAVADFADLVREHLHGRHDRFWDRLAANKGELATGLAAGSSAGVSYRLAIDATLEPVPPAECPDALPAQPRDADAGGESRKDPLEPATKTPAVRRRRVSSLPNAPWRAFRADRHTSPASPQRRSRRASS